MLLFYFKYARCIVGYIGEIALKLLSTFTTLRAEVAFQSDFCIGYHTVSSLIWN